jgi:hypothetical protein
LNVETDIVFGDLLGKSFAQASLDTHEFIVSMKEFVSARRQLVPDHCGCRSGVDVNNPAQGFSFATSATSVTGVARRTQLPT